MTETLFCGVRATVGAGDEVGARDDGWRWCSPDLDAAIWAAELAEGDGEPRVYVVEPEGDVEDASAGDGFEKPPFPSMTWRSRSPLVVVREVTEWRLFHGTKADLAVGDHLEIGHAANFGGAPRTANFNYFTRTLDAAIWAAELCKGGGRGRVYLVEPTGPFEDDPNLTNTRFRGNPSKSFRSRDPLKVVGELEGWVGHPQALIDARLEGLAKLDAAGAKIDDG